MCVCVEGRIAPALANVRSICLEKITGQSRKCENIQATAGELEAPERKSSTKFDITTEQMLK